MAYLLSGERSSTALAPARLRPLVWLSIPLQRFMAARRRREQRIALATLLELEDTRLEDLGITRFDVIEAVRDHVRQGDGALAKRRAHNAQAWLRSGRSQP
jgi:uncharacterized protein YjiS (DUF1127 family)